MNQHNGDDAPQGSVKHYPSIYVDISPVTSSQKSRKESFDHISSHSLSIWHTYNQHSNGHPNNTDALCYVIFSIILSFPPSWL